MKKKFAILIEARTASTRLPNKILLKIYKNKTFLEYLIDQLAKISKKYNAKIIIATTNSKRDDIILKLLNKKKIFFFRGSEKNVLDRVYRAARFYKVDNLIRITSDCPIIDMNIVDQSIQIFLNNDVDIVTNAHIMTYPIGMNVEIIKTKALNKTIKLAKNNKEFQEHLSLAIKKYKNKFKIINLIAPPELRYPEIGITLDEYNDYLLIKKIVSYFNKKNNKIYSCLEVIEYLKNNPKVRNINKKVSRTKYSI